MTERRSFQKEVATDHLMTLLDFYEIDYSDTDGIEIEGIDVAAELSKNHSKLVKAIMTGRMEIVTKEDGAVEVIQYLDRAKDGAEPLTYKEMTGATGMIAGKNKVAVDDFHGQILCVISGMTGHVLSDIISLKGKDIILAKALGLLFFVA